MFRPEILLHYWQHKPWVLITLVLFVALWFLRDQARQNQSAAAPTEGEREPPETPDDHG